MTLPPARAGRRSREQNDALMATLIRDAGVPVSAYDIVELAGRAGIRLVAPGEVRRIESLNAYAPGGSHADFRLVCLRCRTVGMFEAPGALRDMGEVVDRSHFHQAARLVEIPGFCARCRPASPPRREERA